MLFVRKLLRVSACKSKKTNWSAIVKRGFDMRIVCVLCLVLTLLPGCSSKYGQSRTSVQYYPACYRPIQQLRNTEYTVEKTTAGGAFIGAMGGALLGLLVTGKAEGALVGGVAGAATGAVASNIYAKKKQIADDNRRLASYLEDIDGDIRHLNVVSASAQATLDCYDHKFQELLQLIRTRRISRAEAEERFDEIASGRDEAIAILGNAVTNGRDLDQQYEQAFQQEEQRVQTRNRPTVQQTYMQARQQKGELTRKVNAVSRQKETARERSTANQRDFTARLNEIDA